MRLGLIGVGKHGSRYARHIRDDLPGVRLTAIARRDPEHLAQAAREFGGHPYTDYRKLIACGQVDAIVAVVPPTLHVDIVRAAAAAGLPLLLEKPAAASVEAGRTICRLLASSGIPVMVAQTLRYNAVVRAFLAARAEIGPVRSLTFTQRFEPTRLRWLDDPAVSGGGVILHTGIHGFDLMRVLAGMEADSVSCQMTSTNTMLTEDGFAATVSLGGGQALATVASARTAGARNGHIEVAGERGSLIGDHVWNRAERIVGGASEPLPLGNPAFTVREVLCDFIESVRTGGAMPIPFEEGVRAVAIAHACYESVRTGKLTAVPAVDADCRS